MMPESDLAAILERLDAVIERLDTIAGLLALLDGPS